MIKKRTYLMVIAAVMLSLPVCAQNRVVGNAARFAGSNVMGARKASFGIMPGESMLMKALEKGEISKSEYCRLVDGNIGRPVMRNGARKAANVDVLPYANAISSQAEFDNLAVIDANNDQCTWEFYETKKCARYRYNDDNPGDDWLVTPGIKLVKGKKYIFRLDAARYSTAFQERFEVRMAKLTGDVTADMLKNGTSVIPPTEFEDDEFKTFEKEVTATEDGYFAFGIHAISNAGALYVMAKNITVEAVIAETAPDAPSIEVTPAPMGELNASVKVTAPVKTLKGDNITANLSKVIVVRDGVQIKEFTDVTPGNSLTMTDNQGLIDGSHTYFAIPFDASGEMGKKSEDAKVFIGSDMPKPVDALNIADKADKMEFTWNRVSEGNNGGYVNPAEVKYILRDVVIQEIYGSRVPVLADTISMLTDKQIYDYPFNLDEGKQDYKIYGIQTENGQGLNEQPVFGNIIVGKPDELPIVENFADKGFNAFWYYDGMVGDLYLSTNSSDGDKYAINFHLKKYVSPGEGYLSTGKVNLKTARNPYLLFDAYRATANSNLSVWGSKDGGKFTKIKDVELPETYKNMRVDLGSLKDGRYASVRLVSNFADEADSIIIDNIMIRDVYSDDLGVSISAPATVKAGGKVTAKVTVDNNGENTCNGYTLDFYANDKKIASKKVSEPLNMFGRKEFDFDYATTIFDDAGDVTLKAVVVSTGADLNEENNTAKTTLKVVQSTASSPENLRGTETQQSVKLTWDAPKNPSSDVTEDFESYDKWIYENIGDWTLIDADQGASKNIFDNVDYPCQGEKFAYTVWTPRDFTGDGTADVTVDNPTMTPHSGDKTLASIYCEDANGEIISNDDWLISPELSGGAQTVNFFTSFYDSGDGNEAYPQTYQVLYSKKGKEIADFTAIGGDRVTASTWENVSVNLPEGSKYFAIRNITDNYDSFLFLIDDITYSVVGEISSYNIYVDGELFTSVGGTTLEAVLKGIGNGNHKYSVSAVYTSGKESKPISTMLVTTDISNLSVDGKPVDIYTVDGKLVRRQATSLDGLSGLYVIDGRKVILK